MTTGCDSHFLKASQLKDVVLFGFTPRTAHPLPDAATLAGGVAHLDRSWSLAVPLPGCFDVAVEMGNQLLESLSERLVIHQGGIPKNEPHPSHDVFLIKYLIDLVHRAFLSVVPLRPVTHWSTGTVLVDL